MTYKIPSPDCQATTNHMKVLLNPPAEKSISANITFPAVPNNQQFLDEVNKLLGPLKSSLANAILEHGPEGLSFKWLNYELSINIKPIAKTNQPYERT